MLREQGLGGGGGGKGFEYNETILRKTTKEQFKSNYNQSREQILI